MGVVQECKMDQFGMYCIIYNRVSWIICTVIGMGAVYQLIA